jgi:hypothetical protein
VADEAWAEHYYGPEPAQQPRPAGPDPARDARINVYRDRERRRAARALDRYIEIMFSPPLDEVARRVAGERFVEEIGDYVLARLGERDEVPAVVQRYLVDDGPMDIFQAHPEQYGKDGE